MKVHLASRDVLTIAGLRQLLKPCAFISISGVSSSDESTLAAMTANSPDVLVVSSADEQEIAVLVTAARTINAAVKVVVLADELLAQHLVTSSPTRLEAILVKDGDYLEDIGAVLRIVHRGGQVTTGRIAWKATTAHRGPIDSDQAARLAGLSAREVLIMREVAAGRTNAQIGRRLHVSVATIKANLARVMELMQASTRVDLAVQAVQCGLVDEPGSVTARIIEGQADDETK